MNFKKMSNFSERLAQEIERIGGVTAVSERLGTARNTLYNWISKENIPANKMLALGELGVDVSYILTGARTQPPQALGEPPAAERGGKGRLKGVERGAPVREEASAAYAAEDPLARRKAMLKLLIDQMQDPKLLDALQTELEEIERVKGLERRVAELERKAG